MPTNPSLSPNHQTLIDRFISACQADHRIVAAFLGGSYASGQADAWSDIDLGLVTTDDSYAQFLAEREAFVPQLGSPAFIEDFGHTNTIFFIFPDGTDAELGMGRESDFLNIHSGPYTVLLDKTGILDNVVFPYHHADPDEQHETLRRLIHWFWHDLTHLITALGRNQLWWAYGQIDELRGMCINLARLHHNFSAPVDNYDKIEKAVPLELLMPLQPTFCLMERGAMLQAGLTLVEFYKVHAIPLAQAHAIPYPESLEHALVERLKALSA
jgi:Streptomycin adenylyltransferase